MPIIKKTTNDVLNMTEPKSVEEQMLEKLTEMSMHLQRLDRRDKMRTWGGFIRGIIGLIPIVIIALGAWYAYSNTDELIRRITSETTKQMMQLVPGRGNASSASNSSSTDYLKQLQEMFNKK